MRSSRAQRLRNRRRLEIEIADFLGVVRMLGLNIREEDIIAKVKKVEKYMAYSRNCGTLDGTRAADFRKRKKAPKCVVAALRKARDIRG